MQWTLANAARGNAARGNAARGNAARGNAARGNAAMNGSQELSHIASPGMDSL
jgi:hypothetical protein